MKQVMLENIKQLSIAEGGGIFGELGRVDTINHPVLVIGLGGTGTDALLRLKYHINRRFKLPENPVTRQKKQKPDNIEYLSLETNEHDKKKYRGISLDPFCESVFLSNAGIGGILNNRSTLPDYISSWLDPRLTITDGTKGASGNRQAGRLLLFEKINTAIDSIDNKMKALRTNQENKLLVFILSGLSGGTGGGMFLDVAYIVRGLMEREYGGKGIDKVEITGYLFTPDVHLAGNNLSIHTQEYIQRNGYAALKELDYFMNIEERGERFSQTYGTRLSVNSGMAPFNLCHLVSGCNIDGVFLNNAYDYCMNVTAESIANFLALEDKESGNEFAIQDYHSNLISNIGTMKSNLPYGMQNAANFVYNIIGASAAIIPAEGMNTRLAHAFFCEIEPLFDATPLDGDTEDFVRAAGLTLGGLGAKLNIPQIKLDYAETDYYSHKNVIKTRRVDITQKLEELYTAARRELTNGASQAVTASAIENAKRELREIFLNPAKGPMYVARFISNDLRKFFEDSEEELRNKIDGLSEETQALQIAAENRREKARRAIFLKEREKNAYIEAEIAVFEARLQKEILAQILEMYRDIRREIESENDNVYAIFDEILRELRKILAQNALIGEDEKSYHWDIVSAESAAPEAEIQKLGFDALVRDFAKFLIANAANWLGDEPEIAASFSRYICEKFEQRSMPQLLRECSTGEPDGIAETEIAPRLYRDAKPIFHMDNAAGIFTFPSYGMVSVPRNAPEIARGIEAYQRRALANLRFNIRKSCIEDRIFWLNTQNGIPLFAYTPIRVCEELYERTIDSREAAGRHLVMNENESWVNLPSPLPESLWGDTYENPRQKALNDDAREIFRRAKAAGKPVTDEDFFIRCPQHITRTKSDLSGGGGTGGTSAFHRGNVDEVSAFSRSRDGNGDFHRGNVDETSEFYRSHFPPAELVEDFLRVLVYEAIVKRGALYLYEKELEEDPWPSFANLMDNAEFPEYTMFCRYKSLDDLRQKILHEKVRTNERAWPADKLIISLKKWQGKIAIRKNQLDNEMWKFAGGKDMYNFYRTALLQLNAQVAHLHIQKN